MHITRSNAIDFFVHSLQAGQNLLNTENAEGATALELGEMQGHVMGLNGGLTGLETDSPPSAEWAGWLTARILPAGQTL